MKRPRAVSFRDLATMLGAVARASRRDRREASRKGELHGEEARFRDRLGRPLPVSRGAGHGPGLSLHRLRRAARRDRDGEPARAARPRRTRRGRATASPSATARPSARRRSTAAPPPARSTVADFRFTGDGELRNARVASFDLANLDRDRRLEPDRRGQRRSGSSSAWSPPASRSACSPIASSGDDDEPTSTN